jgi:chromosomal replication initiation ATPase DnaA
MLHERLQLPLPFQHAPRYDARDFIAASSNRDALAWLEADWPEQRLALFGPGGSGKSHLLHIHVQRTGGVVLAGQTLTDLAGVPRCGTLALDDADTVADETLLFHLLNTARDRRLNLLLSCRAAPSRWPVRLQDLSSRLRATAAVEIGQPDDEMMAALLMRLLADRQLAVARPVQEWLLLRLPRSPSALREAVVRLDRASMVFGSAITRPLAARVLAENGYVIVEPEEAASIDQQCLLLPVKR